MTTSVREIVGTGPGTPPERPADRRMRVRRILHLAGLVPLLATLAFSGKVFMMLHHDGAGEDAWIRGDGPTALEQYSANRSLNLLEPWIAPFDEGDAAFLLHDYAQARDLFVIALTTVPHPQECTVRINLALSYEAIGDAASSRGALDEATADWQHGITTLAEGDCPLHAGQGPRQSQDAATVRKRLEDRLSRPAPSPPRSQQQHGKGRSSTDAEPPSTDPRMGRLNRNNDRGQKEHRDASQFDFDHNFDLTPQW